tara:strand:- start:350 stop:820 length:471 start_codon:yes stop_codon:yes gene_type:complete
MTYLVQFTVAFVGVLGAVFAVYLASALKRQDTRNGYLRALRSEINSILDLLEGIKADPSEHPDTPDKKKYCFDYYGTPQKYCPVYLSNPALSGLAERDLDERITEFYSKLLNMKVVARSSLQLGIEVPYVGIGDIDETIRRAKRAAEAIDRTLKGK